MELLDLLEAYFTIKLIDNHLWSGINSVKQIIDPSNFNGRFE
jgi:hypothetical protein